MRRFAAGDATAAARPFSSGHTLLKRQGVFIFGVNEGFARPKRKAYLICEKKKKQN